MENWAVNAGGKGPGPDRDAVQVADSTPTNRIEFRLPGIDGRTRAARHFRQLMLDLVADAGGAERCSAVRRQLIARFAGASTLAREIERRVALGESIDVSEYALLAGVVNRIGQRLGLNRRAKPVETIDEYLERKKAPF